MKGINLKKVYNYLSDNRLFLIYVLLCSSIGLTLRIVTVGGMFKFLPFITDLLFVIFFGSLGYLFKDKHRYRFYLFLLFFFAILSFINTLYYQFYQSFVSVNLLSTVSMVGKVNDSLFAKIHLVQFIYLIYPIIFIVFKKKIVREVNLDISGDRKFFIVTALSCIVVFLIAISIYSIKDARKFNNQYNREYILRKYGLYLYTFNDLFQSLELDETIDYDTFALAYRNHYACKWEKNKITNEYTDLFKDKNVLFIHAESIQNFLIDLKINDKYVTPNINKFAKEGIYFSKFYPQISVGTSSDTEFTLLSGLLPSSNGTVFVNYYDREYPSLVDRFNGLGYHTFSMHGNDREYWNRATMHNEMGYKIFYGQESYMIPDVLSDEYVGLGISDSEFFKQSMPLLKDIHLNNEKFMGTIITLSNHSPFNDVEKYGEFDVTMKYKYEYDGRKYTINADYLEGTTMGNYLKSSHYADKAFGEFMDSLEKEGLLEDLVIVFYGDHESRISKKEFNLLYNYNPLTNDILNEDDSDYININQYNYELLRNTPLIIWSSDQEFNLEVSEVMGMYDVLPTMANLFGFKEDYSLGHDIFSDEENIVVFPNGNVLTDKVYYNELNEEYITFSDEPISSDYIERIREHASDVIEVSNGIIKYDLIKKEGKNVGECNE